MDKKVDNNQEEFKQMKLENGNLLKQNNEKMKLDNEIL